MLVGLESVWRARRSSPPGVAAARLDGLVLLVVTLTAAGGLGLLLGGGRPHETLHFVYAVIAIGALPVAVSLATRWEPRRRAIVTLLGALVALVAILRLFATG